LASLNVSSQYNAAMRRMLSKETLPITVRYLVAYQFATKKRLEKGAGVTWTATRFNRLTLPFQPLSEGVPPIGEQLSISQVTGVALQWGDKVTLTDVAVTTTMYDLIKMSKDRLGIQIAETHERNTFASLMGGTQTNYVNQRGARASLVAGDVLDTVTLNRTYSDLENLGAPFYNGQVEANVSREIEHGASASEKGPKSSEHYVAIISPLVENDLRQNQTIVNAWSFSDVTRLYINEVGYWSGIHFTKSNMMPRFVGNASSGATYTPGTSGSLATGTYYIQVTGTDMLNQFGEQQIYQVSGAQSVTGPNGSINVTVPSTTDYTYSVYISTSSSTSPVNLGLTSTAGVGAPTTGPAAGNATQINPGSTVTITGLGVFIVPPAAPATGVTVYPTFVFGSDYFACTILEDISWTNLFEADKSDPLNQLRVIGWKMFEGFVICNQQFGCRIESSVSNSGSFG
jgi:N4-gp56 family major capsid protein